MLSRVDGSQGAHGLPAVPGERALAAQQRAERDSEGK